MKTTKETREVLQALGAVVARKVRVSADGKITIIEKLGFLGDAPEVYDAMSNIADVPSELMDLDMNEYTILVGDIRMILIEAGISHRNSDIAEWILEWAYSTIRNTVTLLKKIKEAPPSAVLA